MKKRLVSALLALCMVLALLPETILTAEAGDIFEFVTEDAPVEEKKVDSNGIEPVVSIEGEAFDVFADSQPDEEPAKSVQVPYAASASGTCGDNLTWAYSNGTLFIQGMGLMDDYYSSVDQPWSGYYNQVHNVIIGEGVTSIGDYAFSDCSNLTTITIPSSVTTIGHHTFWRCESLTSVTIPDSVTSIKYSAFSGCSGLTSVTISNNVTSVGLRAFEGCTAVSYVKVTGAGNMSSDICQVWGSSMNSLKAVDIESGITSIGSFFGHCSSLTSITIPDSVTTISDFAFEGCTELTSVIIPNISIASSTFRGCTAISYVKVIGAGVMSPDISRVWKGSKASSLVVELENGITSVAASAFSGCDNLTSVSIPGSVTNIGESAFYGCTSLTSVAIPNGVTSIGTYAFRSCSGLTSANIPNSVISIGNSAFRDCSNLTSVTIPDSITSIGTYVFRDCSNLTSVTIPDSVTSIAASAFHGCSSLTSVSIPGNAGIGADAFGGCTAISYIKVTGTGNMLNDYTFLHVWRYSESALVVDIENGITSIGVSAFSGCSNLISVTLSDSVTSIGSFAFSGCSGLTSVTIPDNVTHIDDNAFYDCSGLTSVTIPSSVTSIGSSAFFACNSLNDVYYSGFETDWRAVSIGNGNSDLTNATIHYNSNRPDNPSGGDLGWGDNQYTLEVGKTLTLTVRIADGSTLDASKLNWNLNPALGTAEIVAQGSLDEQTAYVTLKGIYPGKVILTGTLAPNPGESILNRPMVSQEITVIGNEPIRFDRDSYTITVGETIGDIIVRVPNPNGLSLNDITFISSNPEVIPHPTASGVDLAEMRLLSFTLGIRGVKTGTAIITVSTSDGRSASCTVTVRQGATIEPPNEHKVVIGDSYSILVGNTGKSFAPVPDSLKESEIAWLWESSDSSIVSFSPNGILGEMGGEGNPSSTVMVPFYARRVGTVTLTCSIDNNIFYSQEIVVVDQNSGQSTIESNDYNVQLRDNAVDKFSKEFEKVEVAYQKFLTRIEEKLNKPESIYPINELSIEEQAQVLLSHDANRKNKEKFLSFSPSTPDAVKLSCYEILCEQLYSSAKESGFSLKDISLSDPFQTELISKMAKLFGEKIYDEFTKIDSNGRKIIIKADFISLWAGGYFGTLTCYYYSNPNKTYTCYLMPSAQSAEEGLKAYLNELIDLEYRAINNVRKALIEDLVPFTLESLAETGVKNALDIMHTEAGALEEYKLLGLDGTIYNCYEYGKSVKDLKSKIANNPTDIEGIISGIEALAQWDVPEVDNVLRREVSAFLSAQKNFRQNILSKIITKDLPWWTSKFTIKCPVNVSAMKDGQLVGYAGEDDFWYNDGLVIEEYGDAKIIYYNLTDAISFEITGTADGSMSYTIERFEEGAPVGRINSDVISVYEGQVFTANFPDKDLEDHLDEFTLSSNGEIIRPLEYISVNESARVDVDVIITPSNSGNVYGTGAYVRGDAAVLYESPKAGYIFSGWYDNSGTLVSTSSYYEFSAMDSCTLEARFSVVTDDDTADSSAPWTNPFTDHYNSAFPAVLIVMFSAVVVAGVTAVLVSMRKKK